MTHLNPINDLALYPQLGFGYFPPDQFTWSRYNDGYSNRYKAFETDKKAHVDTWDLNRFRLDLTNKYTLKTVLDVGIGAGTFIRYRSEMYVEPHKTLGYDINPKGVEWLKSREIYLDPYKELDGSIPCMTLWDVIEHLEDPRELIKKVSPGGYVLITTPIYSSIDYDTITNSKHYKPGEHIWYFTEKGLKYFFRGFDLVERSDGESTAGRSEIGTFVFKKQG